MKVVFCLFVLFSAAARADDAACARISPGLSSEGVLKRCGQPAVIDSRQEEWHADDGSVVQVDTVERWTYDLGPDRFIRIFSLRNGVVVSARTGGYGTSRHAREPRDCGSARISVGDLKQEILTRCGDPSGIAVRAEATERGARTIYETVEEWVYDLGPSHFVRTYTFRNGRLALIETGGYGTP
ncbi:MAG TPA: DUF2845 domain-containing protein [Myxococcales bacterium]|jgi:hypothetical protein|nr:DUF2845 domain-containing protein [Myxococcales bacterium]